MAIDISFEIEWGGRLSRRIEGISANIKNLKPFFKKTADLVDTKIDKVFDSRWSVLKWKKRSSLSQRTIVARRNRWWHYKLPPNNPSLLRWTGNLQDNRTKNHTNSSAQITFNAPYAVHHHFGKGRMKRRLIQLDEKLNAEIMRALVIHINDQFWIPNVRW